MTHYHLNFSKNNTNLLGPMSIQGVIRIIATTILSVILFHQSNGQQGPQWTQYAFNQYLINPAYGGLDRSLSITAGIRSQWSPFPGAPRSQMITGHLPLYFLNGSAGMTLLNEELGVFRRTGVSLGYNYVVDSPLGLFSTGFRVGVQQISLRNEDITTPSGSYIDQSIDHNDPRLNNVNLSGYAPTWSLGMYYIKDLLEIGISVDNPANTVEAGSSTFNEDLIFSIYGSYQYPISELLAMEPNVFVKTDGKQTQVDIGVLGYYSQFIGGMSLRGYNANSIDALGFIAGVKVSKHVRISYSFDLGISGFRTFHDGTHEFLINYNLSKPIRTGELPRIIYNPRYN